MRSQRFEMRLNLICPATDCFMIDVNVYKAVTLS